MDIGGGTLPKIGSERLGEKEKVEWVRDSRNGREGRKKQNRSEM